MLLFTQPRPDHVPPESLDDAALAVAIETLRRKAQSVRGALRRARFAGLTLLLILLAGGFMVVWVGQEPFLPRIYQDKAASTVPELLAWWTMVIGVLLFAAIVGVRLFTHRLHITRGWTSRAQELDRRLEHALKEARRRE